LQPLVEIDPTTISIPSYGSSEGAGEKDVIYTIPSASRAVVPIERSLAAVFIIKNQIPAAKAPCGLTIAVPIFIPSKVPLGSITVPIDVRAPDLRCGDKKADKNCGKNAGGKLHRRWLPVSIIRPATGSPAWQEASACAVARDCHNMNAINAAVKTKSIQV
jgi:hypothetical protein